MKSFPMLLCIPQCTIPKTAPWAKNFKVIPSFMQKIPFAKTHHELFPWLTPLAFESFDFSDFDIVISFTSAEAKGIITKPKHCIFATVLRQLDIYGAIRRNILCRQSLKPLISKFRIWDQIAANRPDSYLAISENVASRIRKYYKRRQCNLSWDRYEKMDNEIIGIGN